jgi:hypothetical protein
MNFKNIILSKKKKSQAPKATLHIIPLLAYPEQAIQTERQKEESWLSGAGRGRCRDFMGHSVPVEVMTKSWNQIEMLVAQHWE